MNNSGLRRAVIGSYVCLVLLQPVWHFLLPPPMGARLWWLALLATLPLLLPLQGIVKGSLRSLTWGGYLVLLYFLIGVMEAWSNPPQRLPALLQTALVTIYVATLLPYSKAAATPRSAAADNPGPD